VLNLILVHMAALHYHGDGPRSSALPRRR